VTVSVLVPFRAGCPYRDAAWRWVQHQYHDTFPGWEIVTGKSGYGPFNRSQAILDAASHATGDTFVVADADVFTDGLETAVEAAQTAGWAVPHLLLHRLSKDSTARVLAGDDWRGLPLSTDNRQDAKPYRGNECGTLVVVRRDVLNDVPPDVRFVGWAREDQAWALALRTFIGQPWRGTADLPHLWHPPQPRPNRVQGSAATEALYRRYLRVRRDPDGLRALLDEAKAGVHA
jgi:hypothetical protein